jgi:hypothetical protein
MQINSRHRDDIVFFSGIHKLAPSINSRGVEQLPVILLAEIDGLWKCGIIIPALVA